MPKKFHEKYENAQKPKWSNDRETNAKMIYWKDFWFILDFFDRSFTSKNLFPTFFQ